MENIKRLTLHPINHLMYLKKIIFFALFFCANSVIAQDKLIAAGPTGDLYINHTVKRKETFSVLSRNYCATTKQNSAYKNLNANSVLTLGVNPRISFSEYNLVQKKEVANEQTFYKLWRKW